MTRIESNRIGPRPDLACQAPPAYKPAAWAALAPAGCAGGKGVRMLLLTPWFFLFACVVFPAYWIVRRPRARLFLLLVSCIVFHTWFAGPAGVLPVVVLGAVAYLAGLSRRRSACLVAIALCAAALVFYKYTRFLCLDVVAAL